jgi:hypothetical protein
MQERDCQTRFSSVGDAFAKENGGSAGGGVGSLEHLQDKFGYIVF